MSEFEINEEDALYRNQFLIAPEVPAGLDRWKREKLGGHFVATHPALSLLRRDCSGRSSVLIGFILDPDSPERDDGEILASIHERLVEGAPLVDATATFGGRWAIVSSDRAARTTLLHDPGGLRQVFYARAPDGSAICASQPDLIAEIVRAEPDPASSAFMASDTVARLNGRHWWPGDRSPFLGVRRLVANHELELESASSRRVWPLRRIARRSLDEAVERGATTIRGLVDAAARRFDLALFLTAGWDSRLVLAASRSLGDQALYMSNAYPGGDPLDQSVPGRVLEGLGLRHRLVSSDEEPSEAFRALYARNTSMARTEFAAMAEALLPHLRQRRVAMTGHLSEIVKGFHLRPRFLGNHLDGSLAAQMVGMAGEPFAIGALDDWLADVEPNTGVNTLDLLYWEQNAANMQASWLLEWDLVWGDAAIPMNSRALLEMLLGVPYRHRRIGELHRRLIVELWPETLAVPMKGKFYSVAPKRGIVKSALAHVRYVAKEAKSGLRYLRGERA